MSIASLTRRRLTVLLRASLILVGWGAITPVHAQTLPTISTDLPDYAPGSTVQITGSGWTAGETVTLQVAHADGTPVGGAGHDPWDVTADENGGLSSTWYVDPDDSLGSTLRLTADGATSGAHAETTFTDAINLQSRESTCSTETNSFVSPATVCMRATGIGGPFPKSGEFKWWAPGLNPATDPATRTQSFTASSGNVTDSFAVTACGTWTVKVFQPAGTLGATDTFDVTGCFCTSVPAGQCCNPADGTLTTIDDGNACTTDTCNANGSVSHTAVANGTSCSDGNACNGAETCQNGTCTAGTPLDCNDNNPCTTDSCDAATGCVHTNNTDSCDDGDPCTVNDTCNGGGCAGTPCTGPTITCPDDLVLECGDPDNAADITAWLAGASATDNCPGATVSNDYAGLSDGCGNTGSATVTFTATDDCGNTATCTATVTVADTTAPDITCPTDATFECDGSGNTADISGWLASASCSDTCGGCAVSNDYTGLSDGCGATGSATVTFTATDDCGNTATCTQTITVDDTTAPVITSCSPDINVPCSADPPSAVTYDDPTATDNCSDVSYSYSPASVTPAGGSSTTVTCTATDDCGNTDTCTFTVSREALGFEGFLAPIGGANDGPGGLPETGGSFADPLRNFKLGSTVPVKFKSSCGGSPVLTGIHTLQAVKYSNSTDSDPAIDATPTDAATTGNQFRLTDSQWHFNMSTKAGTGFSAGIWKLTATLSDGSKHYVWIGLKR